MYIWSARTPFLKKNSFFSDFRFLPIEKSVIKCLYGCHWKKKMISTISMEVLEGKAGWSKNAKRVRRQTFFYFILTFQVLNFRNSTKEIRHHNFQFMIEFWQNIVFSLQRQIWSARRNYVILYFCNSGMYKDPKKNKKYA